MLRVCSDLTSAQDSWSRHFEELGLIAIKFHPVIIPVLRGLPVILDIDAYHKIKGWMDAKRKERGWMDGWKNARYKLIA